MKLVETIDLKGIQFKIYSNLGRLLFSSVEFANSLDISHSDLDRCLTRLTYYYHLAKDKNTDTVYFGILEFFELFYHLKNLKTIEKANQGKFDQFLKSSIEILTSYQLGVFHPLFLQFDTELIRYNLLTINSN